MICTDLEEHQYRQFTQNVTPVWKINQIHPKYGKIYLTSGEFPFQLKLTTSQSFFLLRENLVLILKKSQNFFWSGIIWQNVGSQS